MAAAITVELDVMQQLFGRPIFLGLVEHPREGERDFVERPAIHAVEIRGRRFDAVVDLERERFVTRADEGATDRGRSLTDGQRLPIFLPRLRHERIESILPFENRGERQARFAYGEVESDNEKANEGKRLSHAREYNVRATLRFVFLESCRICFTRATRPSKKQ